MEVTTTRLPNVKVLLHWPSRMQILEQFDGTIEWKVTERSEGASPQRLSEARERPPQRLSEAREHPPATEQSEGASYALETKVRNLIDGTTSGCTR